MDLGVLSMKTNTIITIGRQFGSGGRQVGEQLAEYYGIRCYDKTALAKAASSDELCQEMIEHHDERPTSSFLYNLVMDTYSFGYNSSSFIDMPISQKVFLAQFDTIKKIADEGPAVFIGRCSDIALAEYPNVLNFFISADENFRIREVMRRYPDIITEQKAREYMNKKDKQRQSYYNYYSSKKWGAAESYEYCLNTSVLGIDGTVKLMTHIIDEYESCGK